MNFEIKAKVKTKVEIGYDDALNSAAWILHDKVSELQHIEPILFNNMKSCLKAPIEEYLAKTLEGNKE